MESVFQNAYTKTQVWDMQGALVVFGDSSAVSGGSGLPEDFEGAFVVTRLGLQFGRQVSRTYAINNKQSITNIGVPVGSMSLSMLWGPGRSLKDFIRMFNSPCGYAGGNSSITIIPFGKPYICNADGTAATEYSDLGMILIPSPTCESISLGVEGGAQGVMPVVSSATMSFNDLKVG